MKWFFAVNNRGRSFGDYSKMIKVAVYTAKKFNNLEAYCIYDGDENELTAWLRRNGVTVIFHEFTMAKELLELSKKENKEDIYLIGTGAFLRVDTPKIAKDHKWKDEYVMYTDCDVMFLQNIEEDFAKMKCKYFSVAPEFDINNYDAINSGVLLMNLKNLTKTYKGFMKYIKKHLPGLVKIAWDQTAYQEYYNKKWDRLDPIYNWKPYWGTNTNAKIVHFHGPKPTQVHIIKDKSAPQVLLDLATNDYFEKVEMWWKYLEEAEKL